MIHNNEEAACGAANTTGGIGRDQLSKADHSKQYSTTGFGAEQDRPVGAVELFLQAAGAIGEEHAIASRRAKDALGYADIRSFRSALEGERQRGAVICGSSRGIYLPHPGARGIPELEQHIRTSEARIRGIAAGLRSARRERKRRKAEDQIVIDELGGVPGEGGDSQWPRAL